MVLSYLQNFLSILVERGGSDLHLVANRIPRIRVDGQLVPLDAPPLSVENLGQLRNELLSGLLVDRSRGKQPLGDFTVSLEGMGRFRCHAYSQGGMPAFAIRLIPLHIPSLKALGLPPVFGELTKKRQGLVIVAGPAGSGKTTTLASFIDKLNDERRAHILTFEQPIEFVHSDKKGFVSQCDIGGDVPDISSALDGVSREDPDVVLVGEAGNRETIEAAISLAESGIFVLLSMCTSSCLLGLQCLVQAFPAEQQALIRHRLALVLEGMVAQALVPKVKAPGRVLALELLMPTPAIRGMIREDKIRQIYSIMQTGQAKHGMQTMNQALADLYRRRMISGTSALVQSGTPDELRQMIHRTDQRMRG
ncbi:PilT/PilU family type 4a pilus ATPase [Candidatus Nitronereus thalassa]|uniref:PilT/PilU family type 4a pilus ATPase n=1 Tax=Candidatus Nitronereus thalassa TaxID=3020898 RepID=A0ABU3K7M2_9BACT|nr:PilT/PilU family type 4a pilus ATPase [Candidatus Nitronereus thalassa]MDT7042343.1 PilT/PilU family type 4a pilus ATPase [Candidatus Nitronereus thalassa]